MITEKEKLRKLSNNQLINSIIRLRIACKRRRIENNKNNIIIKNMNFKLRKFRNILNKFLDKPYGVK